MRIAVEIDDVGAALALMAAPVGRGRLVRQLIDSGRAGNAFEALARESDTECGRFLRSCDLPKLEHALNRVGGRVLALGQEGYPDLLVETSHPPPFLVVRGDPSVLSTAIVGVVGTRRATMTGLAVAERLGRELADAGLAVVSGMALGIDAKAHAGALESEVRHPGKAIGVLGCGLDVIYPKSNSGLFRQVAEEGVLVSEFGIGTPPERWRFPLRNRTIAGLALGVIVVEAHLTGGALSTAAAAREENREVMVVPGSITNAAAEGILTLLRDGATPIANGRDAILAVAGVRDELRIDDSSAGEGADVLADLNDSRPLCGTILDLLGDGVDRSAFEIADSAGVTLSELLDAIERLLASGAVERLDNGLFRASGDMRSRHR